MHIVFQQLIQNAIEHEASQMKLTVEKMSGEIRVTALDDGPGISSGNTDRIFNAFLRRNAKAAAPEWGF